MTRAALHSATGLQVVVFVVAFMIVGEAAQGFALAQLPQWREADLPLARIATLLAAAAVLFGVPALRSKCLALLAKPAKPGVAREVAAALALQLACGFGFFGAMALWWWSTGAEPALARHMGQGFVPAMARENSFSAARLTNVFVVGAILAPLVEELVFRGILYPTWERKWGWGKSAVATSIAFGLIHPAIVPQFFSSLVLVFLYRRTGSLWACIACHSAFNVLMWHPLLGRFLVPGPARETGELQAWTLNLVALLAGYFGVAIYAWLAREKA
jgi:membrane protease YdiL (CAAX protease family)